MTTTAGAHRRTSPPTRPNATRLRVLAAVVIVVGLAGGIAGHFLAGSPADTAPAPTPTALVAPTSSPPAQGFRAGTVTAVNDDGTVQVDGTRLTIAGASIPGPGQCGHDQAIGELRTVLLNEGVTVVPDAAVPDPAVGYVVTHDEQSVTDRLIVDGLAMPAPGPWWTYGTVAAREARDSANADAGLHATCWRRVS